MSKERYLERIRLAESSNAPFGVGNYVKGVRLIGTRYLGLDDLVQEVKSLTQAAEPAWAMLVNNASSAVDMLTISKTIESIAVEAQADPGCIDLSRINRKSPSPQHLVALLRTTYAFKDKITGWSELRDFAKAYVDEKGFVSARVMKGLDD